MELPRFRCEFRFCRQVHPRRKRGKEPIRKSILRALCSFSDSPCIRRRGARIEPTKGYALTSNSLSEWVLGSQQGIICREARKRKAENTLREFFKKWRGVGAWVSDHARVGFGFAARFSGLGAVSTIIDRQGGGAWFGSRDGQRRDCSSTICWPASGRNYQ